jgi:hypothetical protein
MVGLGGEVSRGRAATKGGIGGKLWAGSCRQKIVRTEWRVQPLAYQFPSYFSSSNSAKVWTKVSAMSEGC